MSAQTQKPVSTATAPDARQFSLPVRVLEASFPIGSRRGVGSMLNPLAARHVGLIRALTQQHLDQHGLPKSLVYDAVLVVSELVTNVVTHSIGGRQASVRISRAGSRLRITVAHDGAPGQPTVLNPHDDEEHGRGLRLVEGLAAAHGGTWGAEGPVTWCELALPADLR
ncbi:ATP-binding protein [Streptomyces spectabilis]|uniref:ATP-binding protein n=1 Tax=Streptomyces spectabilis TaxID=68270 RepID=UPI0033FE8CAC